MSPLLVDHLDVGEVDKFFTSTRGQRAFVDLHGHHLALLAALPETLDLLLQLRRVDLLEVGVGQEPAGGHLRGLLGFLLQSQQLRLALGSVVVVIINFLVARMEDVFPVALVVVTVAFRSLPFLATWNFGLGFLSDGLDINDLGT